MSHINNHLTHATPGDPTSDRAVLALGRLWTWDDFEKVMPGRAELALDRVEANGLDHFTNYHPLIGYLIAGEMATDGGGQDGPDVVPPVVDPPIVIVPPVDIPGIVVVPPPDGPPPNEPQPNAIPEPSSLTLWLVGLAAILGRLALRRVMGR